MRDTLQHRLQERVKELTALHGTARLLQETGRPLGEVMSAIAALLPAAWQYPEVTEGRITLGGDSWTTPGFAPSPWSQREEFHLLDGTRGSIEVAYREEQPPADEGPFLHEERELIRSLAEILRAHCQHRQDDARVMEANERLEQDVLARTRALRRLASELCLAEERERRTIAEDLHDHLGQGLALVRARLHVLRGDAIFAGHGAEIDELLVLVDQSIRYTRTLTFELSPPVLYELGLPAGLDWLSEQIARKHGLRVHLRSRGSAELPDDVRVLLYKSARELLHNVVRHAEAREVRIRLAMTRFAVGLTVRDDGRGFRADAGEGGFGLFSIRERLHQLGGRMRIDSLPGRGTVVRLRAELPASERP
ncbi:MAG: sensor histidine kinase [Candidatus Eisenbacteria bacterium]